MSMVAPCLLLPPRPAGIHDFFAGAWTDVSAFCKTLQMINRYQDGTLPYGCYTLPKVNMGTAWISCPKENSSSNLRVLPRISMYLSEEHATRQICNPKQSTSPTSTFSLELPNQGIQFTQDYEIHGIFS
jgi:hypothetical protein